jgi:predicted transcriptional regulator
MHSLVQQFSDGPILVFDIHSYNYKRGEREVPEINVGTSQVDRTVWGTFIERYLNLLSHSFDTFWVAENNTFFGKGAFLQQLMNQHENCLVLATEFKKYFCDELTAEVYLEKVEETAHKLQAVIDKMLISEL